MNNSPDLSDILIMLVSQKMLFNVYSAVLLLLDDYSRLLLECFSEVGWKVSNNHLFPYTAIQEPFMVFLKGHILHMSCTYN